MKTAAALQVLRPEHPPEVTHPPLNRGRLLSAVQVAADLFNGSVSTAWVRRNVPGKIMLGHSTARWYEADVLAWIETRRTCQPA